MQSPPPTEYFPGIQFNPYYYQDSYEPVTRIYVDTNFLKCVGYAYSRSIATTFSGSVTPSLFSGSGAGLTNLNASNISGGVFSVNVGGTGKNTLTSTQILVGNNTNPVTQSGNLTWDNTNNILAVTGTTAVTGDINILGNNRYRIGGNAIGNWLAATIPTDIYYNIGNAGIGTSTPSTKLHILENTINNTTLTIQNNIASLIVATPTPTIKVNGYYTQLEFYYTTDTTGAGQTVYNYTIPSGVVCDILIVGGGGGGGRFGGGGGAGGVLFATNVSLTAGQIKVGRGGAGTINGNHTKGENGADSSLYVPAFPYTFIASGGGGGGTRLSNNSGGNGGVGGCGGGGSHSNDGAGGNPGSSIQAGFAPGFYIYFLSYGNAGGYGRPNVQGYESSHASGGGGGAGGNGSSYNNSTGGGNGGAGRDYSSQFGTSVGHNGWFAGGGGGNTYANAGNRGYANGGNGLFGGGGNGGYDGATEFSGENALANTGGGGGGSKWDGSGSVNGGNGGSGAVIIRYLTPTSISSVNLVRGDTTDGNVDYKIENNNGDFKIKTSATGTDTDRFTITSDGNININNNLQISGLLTSTGLITANGRINFNTAYYGSGADFACNKINLYGSGGNFGFGISGGTLDYFTGTNHRFLWGSSGTSLGNVGMQLTNNSLTVNGDSVVGGNTYLRNTFIYSGNEGSKIALYFATPFTGNATQACKSAIITQAISSYSRHHLCLCLNTAADNSTNASLNDIYLRLNTGGYVEILRDLAVSGNLYINNSCSLFAGFYSVPMTNTDYCSIEANTGLYTTTNRWLRVAYGSFTAFHRSYTDDELYNNETDENIDIFKYKFMGRVVIATGKIKTDNTKKQEPEIDPELTESCTR